MWKLFTNDPEMQCRNQCVTFPHLDNTGTGLNIALVGCTDGAAPYDRKNYSFNPIAMACLNLPPWQRHLVDATHLCGIIPGWLS
jgi:hypothetical protein